MVENSEASGPCKSEDCVRPDNLNDSEVREEVLGTQSDEKEYSPEFLEHMRKHEISKDSPAWRMLWDEWLTEEKRLEAEEEERVEVDWEEIRDEDGAVCFDGQPGEARAPRMPRVHGEET